MRQKRFTVNDEDRKEWVNNDEGLYRWWRSERVALSRFVRENRDSIDEVIEKVTGNKIQNPRRR